MRDELPELNLSTSAEPIDYDSLISDLSQSVSSIHPEISVLDDLKKRNKELANLISNYQKKSEVVNLSTKYNSLRDEISSKEDMIIRKEESISSDFSLLQDRESQLHEDISDLEQRKLIVDNKERILSQSIISETNPQVISVLNSIDSRISLLSQEKSFLSNQNVLLKEERRRLNSMELNLLSIQKSSLQKKRQLEQDSQILNSDIEKKKFSLQSLDQKRLDLDMLIRERTQLVQDLDKQFYTSKSELVNVKSKIASELKLFERTKSDLETQRQDLLSSKSLLDEQKQLFHDKMRTMSEQVKSDLDIHKKQVIGNLSDQTIAFDEKVKNLEVHEKMLLKLESELKRRESSLSDTLEQLSSESTKLNQREELVSQKLVLASQKESDVKSYEDEVATLERTVFDLKSIIEQKNSDLTTKEKSLNHYAKELNSIKKSLAIEQKFLPIVNSINSSLESGDVFEAQGLYGKLNLLFKSGSPAFQSSNFSILKTLHLKISRDLKSKVLTKK